MAEQLRFDEVLGERRAVDGDEGGAAARAARVDRAREQLLAGSRFADDQRARAAMRQQSRRPGELLLDGRALAHDGGERLGVARRRDGNAAPRTAARGRDRAAENLEIVGQREVVVGAAGDELHRRAPPRIGADDQRRDPRRQAVAFEPLNRVPLGAAGRDDDGHRRGTRRDGIRRAEDVDGDIEVLGEIIPETAERLGDCDHEQPRHRAYLTGWEEYGLTRALTRDSLWP